MSSHDEDQLNEMEAMEAIYQSDYSLVSRDDPRHFTLSLTPHTDGTDNHVSCRLSVTYPPTYPAAAPNLAVTSLSGLTALQVGELSKLAASVAEAHVGDCCIFQVSTALRDYLVEHNQPSLSMFEQMEAGKQPAASEDAADGAEDVEDEDEPQAKKDARREQREAERKAARGASPLNIAPGTAVTVESFTRWKAQFDDEQRRLREEAEKRLAAAKEVKLTGKQIFMLNLARELEDDEAERLVEEKDAAGAKDKLFWFSEGLYADDDAQLPDDSDDDKDNEPAEEQDDEREGKTEDSTEADGRRGDKSKTKVAGKEKDSEQQQRRRDEQQSRQQAVPDDSRRKQQKDNSTKATATPAPAPPAAPPKPKPAAAAPSKQSSSKAKQPAAPAAAAAGGGGKAKDTKPKGKR